MNSEKSRESLKDSVYSDTITVYRDKGVTTMKVDIIRHETYIEVRLVERDNIFTIFVCEITQSDFYLYKKEQDILVNYDRFLPILVRLFYGVAKGDGSLTAVLGDEGEKGFTLKFVEKSEFRNLTSLTLKFTRPEEYQYRQYLGSLLKNMENDNIKLIKENKMMRDKAIKGDQNMKDKIKYMEEENLDIKKRLEVVSGEMNALEMKYEQEKEEFYRVHNRYSGLDKENADLRYELEQLRRGDYKNKAKEVENANNDLKTELRRLEDENRGMKEENRRLNKNNREIAEKMEKELGTKVDVADIKNRITHMENKIKGLKGEVKQKKERIDQLVSDNKTLTKRLESAQSVYNHFYNKKVDDRSKDDMGNMSFEPENPPN